MLYDMYTVFTPNNINTFKLIDYIPVNCDRIMGTQASFMPFGSKR